MLERLVAQRSPMGKVVTRVEDEPPPSSQGWPRDAKRQTAGGAKGAVARLERELLRRARRLRPWRLGRLGRLGRRQDSILWWLVRQLGDGKLGLDASIVRSASVAGDHGDG